MATIVPVILCGGSGSRLWPLSRERMPKQFLALGGRHTLLQATALRALSISGARPDETVTVTLGSIREEAASQLHDIDPALTAHILEEPLSRNTSAAVAYAAFYTRRMFGPDAVMWVLPSDHHLVNEEDLRHPVRQALEAAEQDYLVTFGIKPTRSETGYGYIRPGRHMKDAVYEVEAFVEKPDLETARAYLDSGLYFWNSGMFMFKAETVLENFHAHAPDTFEIVQDLMDSHSGSPKTIPAPDYAKIPSQPFDIAIMEKTERAAVVMDCPSVSDIGSWTGLWNVLDKDEHGNSVQGRVQLQDCHGCLIEAGERLVACAGLEDMVVVETPDAVLVTTQAHSNSVRALIADLKSSGAAEAVEPVSGSRAWGHFRILSRSADYEIREIVIHPACMQNPQPGHDRSRHWTILEGEATITIDNTESIVHSGGNMSVAEKVPYRIANFGSHPLRLLEIQYQSPREHG